MLYSPWLYAGLSAVSLAMFVLNVFSHGTGLGLIATGGLAAVTGYRAYQGWAARRRGDGPLPLPTGSSGPGDLSR